MANTDNPGNINTELLEQFTEDNFNSISYLIEGQVGASSIKSGEGVPKAVNGRDIDEIGRLQSIGNAIDIDDLPNLIQQCITHRLDYENVAEHDRPIFTQEFSPDDIVSETITWNLITRVVGTTSQGQQMNGRRHNWRPQLREIVYDKDHPHKRLYIYGQWFDNVIELSCWARTSKVANKRALWLERLMQDYTWFFIYKGISAIRYEGRDADRQIDASKTEGNKLHCRPLKFYIRTERISQLSTYVLADLMLKTRVTTDSID